MVTDSEKHSLEIAMLFLEMTEEEGWENLGSQEEFVWAAHSYVRAVVDSEYVLPEKVKQMFERLMTEAESRRPKH